ncbi:MAG: hypothetical protein R2799_05370 [Crocinitomicaceae bacterium]
MRNILLSSSLAFALFLPLIFMSVWFPIQKYKIRKQVKKEIIQGIDKEELVKIRLSFEEFVKELEWEHSKEFEYKGQMYDIVSAEFDGEHIIFYCWPDNEETVLNQQLTAALEDLLGGNQERNKNKRSYLKILKSLYLEDASILLSSINQATLEIISKPFNLRNPNFSPDTPPPIV